MGAEGAIEVLEGKNISNIESQDERANYIKMKEDEYKEKFANPYIAAERGYLDDVIEPKTTRPRLIRAFDMLSTKRDQNPPKKHGNIPL